MGANRLWRFVLIGLVPAALTAVLLGGLLIIAKTSQRCATQRVHTVAVVSADVARPVRFAQHTQLTRWHDGERARGWYLQRGEGPCAFGPTGQPCAFVTPKRLSVLIPERVEPAQASALAALAGLVASAPPDVQVDVIHYATRPGAAPLQVTQAADIAELMLCAQLGAPDAYQACVDASAPRLESSAHAPAQFWQVTTGAAPGEERGPSLARLLHALQPRPGTALVLLGDWSEEAILEGVERAPLNAYLTVVSSGVSVRSAPPHQLACGTQAQPPAASRAASSGLYRQPARLTAASLALTAAADADADALRAAVWRRFEPQHHLAYAASASSPQAHRSFARRYWYAGYLRGLLGWYGLGLLLMFVVWSVQRARRAQRSL
jgi:hypothetical protein